jgi:negative regulator of flagellin synthesis FlgM
MTDPISNYARLSQTDSTVRNALDKLDKKGGAQARLAQEPSVERASVARPGPDTLSLSNIAQKAMQEPGFDRAKVDAIKQAIQDGQYPLDARRIAESFVAIEKMIGE